jgi:hypothetical protein
MSTARAHHTAGTFVALLLALLAIPAMANAGSISVSAAGDRSGTTNDASYGGPLSGVTFEKATIGAPNAWTDLCTTGVLGSCTANLANASSTTYRVRVKSTGAPSGWRAFQTLNFGGASGSSSPAADYIGLVTVPSSNTTMSVSPADSSETGEWTPAGPFLLSRENPGLPDTCQFTLTLVLDDSGSIGNQAGNYASAAKQFVNALAGTSTQLRIVSFNASANASWNGASAYDLASAGDVDDAEGDIDSIYQSVSGATNWDDGLDTAAATGADVTVFITDGNPSTRDSSSAGATNDGGGTVNLYDLTFGMASANKLKATGSRLIGVGVGPNITPANLSTVSGPTAGSDYETSSVANLAKTLKDIANQLCGSRIHFRKFTDAGGSTAQSGWTFTAAKAAGSPVTLSPVTASTTGSPAEQVINIDEIPANGVSGITVDETLQSGYDFQSAACQLDSYPAAASGGTKVTALGTVMRNQDWYCTYRNLGDSATVRVKKDRVGGDGLFDLSIAGQVVSGANGVADSEFFEQLVPAGQVTVAEAAHTGTTLADYTATWSCTDTTPNPDVTTTGTGSTRTFTVEDDHVYECTFTNTRKQGELELKKQTSPASDTGSFVFKLDGTAVDRTAGDAEFGHGESKVLTLATTSASTDHAVSEHDGAASGLVNYLSSYSCKIDGNDVVTASAGTTIADVPIQSGKRTVCTFTNVRKGAVELTKRENGAAPVFATWTFTLEGTGVDLSQTTTVGAGGNVLTFPNLAPGTYELCETGIPAGWTTSLGTIAAGTACDDVVVAAGQTNALVIDNTPPAPAVEVDKEARRQGDQAWEQSPVGGPTVEAHAGDTIEYRFTVTNPGSTPLSVSFDDPHCDIEPTTPTSGDTDADGKLDTTETWVFRCDRVVVEGDGTAFTNTVTVVGTDSWGVEDTETDQARVDVIAPGIDIEKSQRRNGTGDFTDATLDVKAGDTVDYRFAVTNTGDTPLSVVFNDARCDTEPDAPDSGDSDADGKLDVGETWIYSCSHDVVDGDGSGYTNTADVEGTDALGQTTTDEDKVSVDVLKPGIDIEKSQRRNGTGDFTDATLDVKAGDTVNYRFTVTNTGDTPLAVSFDDPRCDTEPDAPDSGDSDADGKLDVGETWIYSCSHLVVAGDGTGFTNTATVEGTDPLGGKDDDSDTIGADVLRPGIDVEKTQRRGAAGEFTDAEISGHAGDTLEYRLEVTNTGDTPLAVSFDDPRCDAEPTAPASGDADDDGKLDVGETWVYLCSHVVTASDGAAVVNTVTVEGTDALGGKDDDTDSVTAKVLDPKTLVIKSGPEFGYPGDPVTYDFTVTNAGNTPLTKVSVGDDRCSPVTLKSKDVNTGATDALDPGDKWVFTCTTTIPANHTMSTANPITNTATVTGEDALGKTVTSTSKHDTRVLHPAIAMDKQGPERVNAGEVVTYALTVTNPGDIAFAQQAVVVTDPRCDDQPVLVGQGGDASPGQLNPGDTWTYQCTVLSKAGDGSIENTAGVLATDPNGRKVAAIDRHTVAVDEIAVLPILPGAARASGPASCVGKTFKVKLRGERIASAVVAIDGKRYKRLTGGAKQRWTIKINPRKFSQKRHLVRIDVRFLDGTAPETRRLNLTFQRCARQVVKPLFTG